MSTLQAAKALVPSDVLMMCIKSVVFGGIVAIIR
jgi:ABC-type transporter Mla maintaining outer membrane lipid asymmetry permease subunit MlaE